MIRMIQSRSSGHAKAYFSDALSKSDYYTSDQELAGYWQGNLAIRLGLEGLTSKETFFALCENIHPKTGESLTPRTRDDRTTGYDINFHCPKSVSILHALSNDEHILKVFQESVTETMKLLEEDAKTRVRKSGQYDDRQTGELVWANFVHQTARPVEGFLPDPHLHSHCFVFNATWDKTENEIKAGQFRDIKRDMPYYQAYFHKTLSDKLMTLGYTIQPTDKSFEIAGVPKRVTQLFSKRTDEIGRIAKEKGITDAKELGELGARTRSQKQKGTSMEELKNEWRKQIEELGESGKDGSGKIIRFAPKKDIEKMTSQECVDHAVLHCFERASVMRDRRLLESAYRFGLGNTSVSTGEITTAFHSDSRIIHVYENSQTLCTTKQVLKEEERMVNLAKNGKGKLIPLYKEVPALNLSGQQARAISHVLTTSNRVSIIRGAAGTGKTTLMKEAIPLIEKTGKQVTIVAPSSDASRGVLKKEGFETAETVARLLLDKEMQLRLTNGVLWVDEAGQLGTKDMKALLELTAKHNAQLILGGDTRQHASVVRGDALRILNTVAGIKTAEVNKIYRQNKEEYRSAVEDLSKGKVSQAFSKLDAIGCIHEADPLQVNKIMIVDYIEAVKKGKSALVISPTHAQGEAVTNEIRERLREEKLLSKKEININKLTNLNLTEAQKKDSRNFHKDQIIQFNQNARGFKRGSVWYVDHIDEKTVHVRNSTGEIKSLPTDFSKRYDVFIEEKISISKGDKIRITRNGFDNKNKRLNNGDTFDVVSVTKKGKIILRNKQEKKENPVTYELDQGFGHITHAHCITSYASQGKTVDVVFISQPAGTFPATDAKQFYVSVSRGRDEVRIYTDDKEDLLLHATELGERQSALELIGNSNRGVAIHPQIENIKKTPPEQKPLVNSKQRRDYEPDI